jgi:hypothetical protein
MVAAGAPRDRGKPVDLELLLVDGDNLLHRVRGRRDEGGVAWLLPRLAAWRPADLRIVVVLDGHPAPGVSSRSLVRGGVEVRHAGSRSADDLIISLLEAMPYGQRSRSAVVTGDRALRDRARAAEAVCHTPDWLTHRLADPTHLSHRPGTAPVGIGRGRRPRPTLPDARPADGSAGTEDDVEGWKPGRGSTRKRGNPHRSPRAARRG